MRKSPTVEVMRWRGALTPWLEDAWRVLLRQHASAQIFACPEWSTFAAQSGIISSCQVVVVRHGEKPIGLFPLHLRSPWVAETVSLLAPDHPAFLIDADAMEEALSGLATWFASQRSIQLLLLTPWTDIAHSHLIHAALHRQQLATRERFLSPTYCISLPTRWEDYLQGLGQSTRKSIRTTEKRLQRDFPDLQCTVLTTPSPASEQALQDFLRLYRQRWADQVGGSHFHDRKYATFFLQAMRWALAAGLAAIPVLSLAEKNVAVSTILRQPQRQDAIFHMIARDTETMPGGYYAPGTFLNVRSLQWAIAQGITTVNIGSGKGDHKRLLGGKEEAVYEITIARSAQALTYCPLFDRGFHIVRRLPAHVQYYLQHVLRKKSKE
jgi:CelD/BcsL family acetyltransferase involved in cellulose biosynthesis